MLTIYTIGVLAYSLGVRLAAWFGHPKAKQWIEGRRRQKQCASPPSSGDWLWFHAASLGEFEQGRPVIEAIKKAYPQYKILLSFFSPSGYEVRKDYALADEVRYLPADTPRHALQWVRSRHVVAAFFIKYEFWFNYMRALRKEGIPLFYISLIISEKSYFFKSYGKWFRKQLGHVTHFFVQDETTLGLLQGVGFRNVTLCGDTRFDRVAAIAKQAKPFPDIERFIAGRKCIIAGSTWPPDERLMEDFIRHLPEDYCLIMAPHDISESHIAKIKAMFPDAVLYSDIATGKLSKTLVVNTIGILAQLYQYARFVYIGGGFGAGIHNIQEPVTFGCPVVFGPKYKGFKEAVDLVALQAAFPVDDAQELNLAFTRLMEDEAFFAQASTTCRRYLQSQTGATEKILIGFKTTLF